MVMLNVLPCSYSACFRHTKRTSFILCYVADGSLTIENPSAELGHATWTGAVAIEDQSVPRLESVKQITTAFTDESSLR